VKTIPLGGDWDLYGFPELTSPVRVPADLAHQRTASYLGRVPGNVELDLVRAGDLPDPFIGNNIGELHSYELYEWWYQRSFETPEEAAGRPTELLFHGVDCIATYWLNDEVLGSSENALIEHRFDVTGKLRAKGANTLTIRLASPLWAATRYEMDPSMVTWDFGEERLWLRKAPHSFGWDIMPRALSAGLWRPVELLIHEAHEIRDLSFSTLAIAPDHATVSLFVQVETNPEMLNRLYVRVTGCSGESRFDIKQPVRFKASTLTFTIPHPRLWWPAGYGDPALYEMTVQLLAGEMLLAERTVTAGIRTVELIRTEGQTSQPAYLGTEMNLDSAEFLFRVNGVPILCKGTNWVPSDAFHSRDAERIPRILEMAADLGCNIIRCWGGNVYEDHAFYDFCDRQGIMIWQDFAMACARYPQTPEFRATMRQEALSVVRKLRVHPSLILWCGDNECDMLYRDPEQNRLTRETLPEAVFQADPHRPYLPSSPYISPSGAARPDKSLMPEQHLWGPRDYYKSSFYTHHTAHFVSEIGYHGCPNLSSIHRFIDQDHLWPWQDNDQWITHCTAPAGRDDHRQYRVELMARQIKELFGLEPEDLETFILASQISQAEAKKYFIEMTRLKKWRRTGVIWWNLMDGWPQFSDAIVDYYFGKKLAYPYIKRVQQPVCLMIDEPHEWHVRVVAGNDSLQSARGDYRVWDAETGETLLSGPFAAGANRNAEVGRIRVSHSEQRLFLISWRLDGREYGNHYLLGSPPFSFSRYTAWLEQIAALAPTFSARDIGK
jgi:beta-mannosidase